MKRHKYNARPTEFNGRRYPSRAHAARAKHWQELRERGYVVLEEVSIPLGPISDPWSHTYRVDALVIRFDEHDTEVYAEDVKGVETAEFRRHRRAWEKRGPFGLNVVRAKWEVRAGVRVIESWACEVIYGH